jgi:hypothetical protein
MAMQDPFEPFKKMMSQYYGNPTKQDLKDTLKKLPKEKRVKDLIKAAEITSYFIPTGAGVGVGAKAATKAPQVAKALKAVPDLPKPAKRELDPALLKELEDFINKNLLPENVADFKSFAVKKKKKK